jgi:5-methylcytosine-specific restriction endonuclease McrBC GTP-binding regulatory subunit McrB
MSPTDNKPKRSETKIRRLSADELADLSQTLEGIGVSHSSELNLMVAQFIETSRLPNANLRISEPLFLRFAAALGSKRFLILSGLAGSGKTKLAQAFARWLSPVAEDGDPESWNLVPVGADWTGSDAVLGYPDGLDPRRYVTRPALELIQRAMLTEGDGTPHFLILDEMNLSHVERYFADMLSLIESGDTTELYQPERDDEGNLCFRSDVDPVLRLPSNLFIIGTVNVDETTYMFSPKVLDRANVIEFRAERVDVEAFLKNPRTPTLDGFNKQGEAFGPAFVAESARSLQVPSGIQNLFQEEMMLFFDLLSEHQAEFGYRVVNEAARFMHFYRVLAGKDEASTDWFPSAMDAVIVQKLLPKLHGSRTKLEGLLWSLAYACGAERGDAADSFTAKCKMAGKAEDEKTYSPENIYAALQAKSPAKPLKAARYPLSFEKILRMYRKLIRDQFVTFAEA